MRQFPNNLRLPRGDTQANRRLMKLAGDLPTGFPLWFMGHGFNQRHRDANNATTICTVALVVYESSWIY